jgi:hypothetical protein
MSVDLFTSNSNLLMAWLIGLGITLLGAVLFGLFPKRLERIRRGAFAGLILPGSVIALIYAFRGFDTLNRPLVHWVFEKNAQDALHLGLVFDPISFAVAISTGFAMTAICFRNRPSIRTSSALALSWLGLGLAASSQTLWLAALGIGIQLLSRIFPLIEGGGSPEGDDALWVASTKRAWIGLVCLLGGSAGLAAQGIRLDFFSKIAWASLLASSSAMIAGGLVLFGLFVMATPVFSSNALYSSVSDHGEENLFISETSLAWISVVIFYRILGNLQEPEWLLAIGIGASVATAGSLGALTFQTSKKNAIHLWLSTLPVATLMILPFIPAREAALYFLGSLISFGGLSVALDHRKTKAEIAAAAIFFLGAFGFIGWATSAGLTMFFSKIETEPVLKGSVFILLLFYSAFGWRLVIRGGDREKTARVSAKWIVLGLFLVVGFGPLLSGRWSGGAIPGAPDWIEGAKAWAWVKAPAEEMTADWTGFGIAQALAVLSLLIGVLAWRTAELFPFAKRYPRGARAAEGLFGLVWIQDGLFRLVKRTGMFWTGSISEPLWDRGIPKVVAGLFSGLRKIGAAVESRIDPLTSSAYGRIFTPAAKLVQWLHGGNVRLYAWFALVWVLIFSIYLTR